MIEELTKNISVCKIDTFASESYENSKDLNQIHK